MAKRIVGVLVAFAMLAVAACSGPPQVNGTVEAVDVAKKTVTLNHEAIPNVPMPAMTMMFSVADPTPLAALKEGDKVRFTAEIVNGALTVTSIKRE